MCVYVYVYISRFDSGKFFLCVCVFLWMCVAFCLLAYTHQSASLHVFIYTQVIDQAGYSQRNIPSLGGGVGYGAEAEDCWFIDDDDIPDGVLRPLDSCFTAPWMY